jgi:recombination protein RecA
LGIVGRSGTYYSFGELRLGQGRDNARKFLEDNPQIQEEIDQKVRAEMAAKRSANYAGAQVDDDEEEPEDE